MGKSSRRSRSRSSGERRSGGKSKDKDRRKDKEKERSKTKDRRHRHRSRSKSHDRKHHSKEESPPKDGDWDRFKGRPADKHRTMWRFDSPPKNGEPQPNAPGGVQSGGRNFTMPGAMDPSLLTMGDPSKGASLANIAAAIGLDANATKAARELYVGNLPPGIDVNQLVEFLNAAMNALKANVMPGNAAAKAWISTDGHFAFVEFRTMEEASNGMQLNGLNCLGYSLRIGRPKTYPAELAALAPPPTVAALDSTYLAQGIAGVQYGVMQQNSHVTVPVVATDPQTALLNAQMAANAVSAGIPILGHVQGRKLPDRMCIMDLPANLSEEKVRELVMTFGGVKYFQLLKKEDASSSGVCICDFEDFDAQMQAVDILTQNTPYKVMKAEEAISQGLLADFVRQQILSGGGLLQPQVPTRVLMLCNLVTKEELLDDHEFEEIQEDVLLECKNYGEVQALEIPRPVRGFSADEVDQTDVGFAFVEFVDYEGSAKARKALSGRRFANRVVECHYFSEIKFNEKDFKDPRPNFDHTHSSLHNPELKGAAMKQGVDGATNGDSQNGGPVNGATEASNAIRVDC